MWHAIVPGIKPSCPTTPQTWGDWVCFHSLLQSTPASVSSMTILVPLTLCPCCPFCLVADTPQSPLTQPTHLSPWSLNSGAAFFRRLSLIPRPFPMCTPYCACWAVIVTLNCCDIPAALKGNFEVNHFLESRLKLRRCRGGGGWMAGLKVLHLVQGGGDGLSDPEGWREEEQIWS